MRRTIDTRSLYVEGKTANILDIEKPEDYRCLVHHIGRLHAGMRIDLRHIRDKTHPPMYLFFQNVHYFQGPLNWVGADFHLASHDELSTLFWAVREANYQPVLDDTPTIQSDSMALITLKTQNIRVKILTISSSIIISSNPTLTD